MNRVIRLNGGYEVAPEHATLLSKIAVLLVMIVEKLDEIGHSFLVKIVLAGHARVVSVEHAMIEEYAGPVKGGKSCYYFEVGCPSPFGGFIGCM